MSQARVCMLASQRESENGGAHPKGGGSQLRGTRGSCVPSIAFLFLHEQGANKRHLLCPRISVGESESASLLSMLSGEG